MNDGLNEHDRISIRISLKFALRSPFDNKNDSLFAIFQIPYICGMLHQKQVSRAGTSNYTPQFLWDVITSHCSWYLFLAQHSSFYI